MTPSSSLNFNFDFDFNPNPNPKNQTMLDEQTYQKMMDMKMTAMAETFRTLVGGAQA